MDLRKKGFTLIELLVVMSIIGVLAAALVTTFSKAAKTARDMKCKANLKNLGQAAMAFSVQTQHFPESYPHEHDHVARRARGAVRLYYEVKGWVNWTGAGRWTNEKPQIDKMTPPQILGDLAYDSITNGTLWSYTGKDIATYLCSTYKKAAVTAGKSDVWRSYVMNHRFHWTNRGYGGNGLYWIDRFAVRGDSNDRNAEMVLMFAELPSNNIDTSEEAADGRLDPHVEDEYIGFNHRVSKRNVAHVVYADGHLGILMEPAGASEDDMRRLTADLCDGQPIDRDVLQKMR